MRRALVTPWEEEDDDVVDDDDDKGDLFAIAFETSLWGEFFETPLKEEEEEEEEEEEDPLALVWTEPLFLLTFPFSEEDLGLVLALGLEILCLIRLQTELWKLLVDLADEKGSDVPIFKLFHE